MARLDIGDRAPDFTLPSNTDENVSLSQFFGKKNLLFSFIRWMSLPCAQEKQRLLKINTRLSKN